MTASPRVNPLVFSSYWWQCCFLCVRRHEQTLVLTWATAIAFVDVRAMGSATMHANHWVTTTPILSAERTRVFSLAHVHMPWDRNAAFPVPVYCSLPVTLFQASAHFCLVRSMPGRTRAIPVPGSVFSTMTTLVCLVLDLVYAMMVHF